MKKKISKEKFKLIDEKLEEKFEPKIDHMDIDQNIEMNHSNDKLVADFPVINSDLLNDVFRLNKLDLIFFF